MAGVQENLTWFDVEGRPYPLSDTTLSTYYAQGPLPPIGQYGLPIKIISHQVPLMPGTREQYVQINDNDIKFPLTIFGSTPSKIDSNRRILSEAMRPTRGVGILQHQADDGTIRQLFCREISRLRDVSVRTPGYITVNLEFSAADPYWYDANWTILTFSPSGVVTFFQNPFLPLHISSQGLSSSFSVSNTGQDMAWPVWQIQGPGTNPTLTNVTTNQSLTFGITLTAGQVLTADTRPLYINITREDGSNQWATVSDISQLWGLVPGNNAITLGMTGVGTASALQMSYKQVWEGV